MLKNHLEWMACVSLIALAACSEGNKTTGVTEDDNAIAKNGSSSSVGNSSSDGKALPKFNVWDGSKEYRVNIGNENAGYWFAVSDKQDGGLSKLAYPVDVAEEPSPNYLDGVIDYCKGLCGTIELENTMATPWAGIGFSVAEDGSTADISEWGGICVTYASDMAMSVMLGVVTAGDSLNWASPFVLLPKTVKNTSELDALISPDKAVTRCAKWSDFKVPEWANTSEISQVGQVLSGEEASKQVRAVLFRFTGNSSQVANFVIKGIGSYDENLPQWSTPVSANDFQSSSSVNGSGSNSSNAKGTSACLWNGTNAEKKVNTGFDPNGEHNAGSWYSYDDNNDGGMSYIEWPFPCVNSWDCMDDVIDYCKGVCGKMDIDRGTAREAVLGVAFNVAGFENPETDVYPLTADISDWGGLCVTFNSSLNLFMRLGVDSLTEVIVEMGQTDELEEKCFSWDEIDEMAEDPQMPAKEAAKKVRNIKFGKRSGESMIGTFYIAAIGKYSANGACGVAPVNSTSSQEQASSSTVATSSSSQVAVASNDTCNFKAIDDLWYGPKGVARVETGLDDGTATSGDWFLLQDRGSAENTKVIWPVAQGNEFNDESFKLLVEYCGGTCATLDFKNAYFAGVGFHVAGGANNAALSTADASAWGGLCVTYASENDLDVVLNTKAYDEFFKPNLLPTVTLPKSENVQTKCIPWIDFKDYEGVDADVTTLSSVYFLVNGESRTSSRINIVGLGKYKDLTQAQETCRESDDFVAGKK